LTKVKDALNDETYYSYDRWDRLTKVLDANDQATE
jgi:YD repeat-containing protein